MLAISPKLSLSCFSIRDLCNLPFCVLHITPLNSLSLINLSKTICSPDNLGPVPRRTAPRSVLGPTQPSIEWEAVEFSLVVKRPVA